MSIMIQVLSLIFYLLRIIHLNLNLKMKFSDLRAGVSTIFENTGCSKIQIKNRLGNQTEVTNQNIMDYLSVIEEKANVMVKRHIIVR